jgi:GT2 family glycosyltransferase
LTASVSIIIIHYKSRELLEAAVESVIQNSGLSVENLEFIIIDNSQDFQSSWVEKLTSNFVLIEPGYNSGFARAVNMGLKAATKEFLCLINQDASLITPNTFGLLAEKTKKLPEKTILGCALQDENRNHQQSVWIDDPDIKREWRFGPIYQKLNPGWQQTFNKSLEQAHQDEGFVHRINGAFLFWKNPSEMQEVLFDEDFFLYGEDIEWALRIKKIGWKFYHIPSIRVMHLGSASSENENIKQMQIICSDWLVIKRRVGNSYLVLLILFTLFNKSLDSLLLYAASLRKNVQKDIKQATKARNRIYFNCLKRYAFKILLYRNFSDKNNFVINLYRDA